MKHMLGDYYSSMPTSIGLWIAGVLLIILLVVVVVSLRKQKLARDQYNLNNSKPARARATYLAAERMAAMDQMEKELPNAITRTRP